MIDNICTCLMFRDIVEANKLKCDATIDEIRNMALQEAAE